MRAFKTLILGGAALLAVSGNAAPIVVNFAGIANGAGAYTVSGGERGYKPLVLNFGGGLTLTIRGFSGPPETPVEGTAYLDAGTGGLGVCKVINAGRQCVPSSDDNVTVDEELQFVFSQDVIDLKFWVNNNHDGNFNGSSKIEFDGVARPVDENVAVGDYAVAAGDAFTIAHHTASPATQNQFNQFYIEKISFNRDVPAPGVLGLIGLALAGASVASAKTRRQVG